MQVRVLPGSLLQARLWRAAGLRQAMHACRYADHQEISSATPTPYSLKGTWCSGITSAPHAEGPGFKSQCVHSEKLQQGYKPGPVASILEKHTQTSTTQPHPWQQSDTSHVFFFSKLFCMCVLVCVCVCVCVWGGGGGDCGVPSSALLTPPPLHCAPHVFCTWLSSLPWNVCPSLGDVSLGSCE